MIIAQITYWQNSIVDKKQNQKTITKCKFAALIKDNLYRKFDLTDTSKYQKGHKIRIRKKSYKASEIFRMIEKI